MAKLPAAPRTASRPKKASAKPTKVPKAPKAKTPSPSASSPSRTAALEIARLALDKKALDVVVLDVRGLASYADFFVLMTAESDPQLGAIAGYLEEQMKARGERAISIEGERGGRWVLIDFGDVVAHVFYQDTRGFYDLEGLWADAPRVQA